MRASLRLALLVVSAFSGCLLPSLKPDAHGSGPVPPAVCGDPKGADAPLLLGCIREATRSSGIKHSPFLVVNPKDQANVVIASRDQDPAKSENCMWSTISVTRDGGASWKEVVLDGTLADRGPRNATWGYPCSRNPLLAFDPGGRLYLVTQLVSVGATGRVIGQMGEGASAILAPRFILATSTNGGDSWSDPIPWFTGAAASWSHDMAVSPKTGTIVSPIYAPPICHVLASRDRGASADRPVPVAPPSDGADLHTCSAVEAGPDGAFVLAFSAGYAEATDVRNAPFFEFVRSTDDGRSFQAAGSFAFQPPARVPALLELAFDASSGPGHGTLYAVYAAWTDGRERVMSRTSADGARTWSEPAPVGPEPATGRQRLPNVAVDANGTAHVVYLDTGWDPAGQRLDLVHARSKDGGKTWTPHRVTVAGFESGKLGVNREWSGFERIGVDARADAAWAAFPWAGEEEAEAWIAAARLG